MLKEIIRGAQKNDKQCMEELVNKFKPLFTKYSRKLNYEDAYQDLIIFFIELVMKLNLDKLAADDNEGKIISYFVTCIHNHYIFLLKKLIKQKKEISLTDISDRQRYRIDARSAVKNECDIFDELNLKQILNLKEYAVIYQIYYIGYTSAELAKKYGTTRQAINQQKLRAIEKIRKEMV